MRLAAYINARPITRDDRIRNTEASLQILPGIQVTRPADAESLEVKRDFARVFISDHHREISQ